MIEPHPGHAAIEPAAKVESDRLPQYAPGEHEIELSKAISLKRIADALNPVDGTSVAGMLFYIEQTIRSGR
jgi:hypothetical protein